MHGIYTFELNNGIRVVLESTSSPAAHCGISLNAGSRDEKKNEQGLAHLIEHCIFKGTEKRKAYHILNRLDSVGGELNAYTTKEETMIYGSVLPQHLERALELLQDICFYSLFPEKEMEKEKAVVIDEIQSYLDSPSEQIFDDFEELLYPGESFGKNILGDAKSLENLNPDLARNFLDRNYKSNEIVISIVGPFELSAIKKVCCKYFEQIPAGKREEPREKHIKHKPFHKIIDRDTFQSHGLIGTRTLSAKDKKQRPQLVLLNNILGGPSLNNRLNLNIREKHGITYNLESNYTTYSDTGVFSVYFGTDPSTEERCINLIYKELDKLRTTKLGNQQLHHAKQQLIGQIALAQESGSHVMSGNAKSLVFYNEVDSLETLEKRINKITSEEILDIANLVFEPKQLSTLIYPGKAE